MGADSTRKTQWSEEIVREGITESNALIEDHKSRSAPQDADE